jgi:hypothetical protein
MNTRIAPVLTLITTTLVEVTPAAFAQVKRQALPQKFLVCACESNVTLQLSCYDREAAEFHNRPVNTSATPLVVASAPATTIAVAPAVGVADPAPEAVAAAPVRAKNSIDNFGFDASMDKITSNVARIRERPYGELII